MKTKHTYLQLVTCILLSFSSSYALADPENNDRQERRGPPQFSQLDVNKDGEITLEEFSEHQPPFGTAEEVFARIDANGDNIISEEELTSHKPPRCCHDKEKR